MKKIVVIFVILLSGSAFSQAPNLMSYQAVIWDTGNNLVTNSTVGIQFSILQGSVSGTAVYVETHSSTTNNNGLVTLEIGNGTVVSGSMSLIDWSAGPYFLKSETDPTGGTNYTITGTSQFLSVPYAFYATNVENDLDEQTLSLSGSDLTISNGNTITLPTGGSADNWGTQVVQSDATLSGDGTTGNELTVIGDLTDDQTLSLSGTDLTISGGNTVDLSPLQDGVNDADADPANEINTSMALVGNNISITDAGGTLTVDLTPIVSGVGVQTLSFTSPDLTISGGNTVDLSALQDGVNDADADPSNEIQTLSQVGNNITLSMGGGTVTIAPSADDDPTNELQDLTFSNDTVYISNGNSVYIGPEDVIYPTLNAPFTNYGGAYRNMGYYKQGDRVYFQGLGNNANPTGIIFNLPVGYRPSHRIILTTYAGGNVARIDVETNGDVFYWAGPGGVYFTLDGLSFRISN
ncbi:MAG: hypothetical protein H6582_10185 [Crocinitomicaceae bacterium]|nr:hypothetical protein [Crocinitomicaceae bacterium]